MSKQTLKTYSITALKSEAGNTNIGWVKIVLEVASKVPNFPIPGYMTTLIQHALDGIKSHRDYLEAKLETSLKVKVGAMTAIDKYSSSPKVRRLLAAQATLLSDELVLVDDALSYDNVRHNFSWEGRLMELRERDNKDITDTFCVLHPNPEFLPIGAFSNVSVISSCTHRDRNFSNMQSYDKLSHKDRQAILAERKRILERKKSGG